MCRVCDWIDVKVGLVDEVARVASYYQSLRERVQRRSGQRLPDHIQIMERVHIYTGDCSLVYEWQGNNYAWLGCKYHLFMPLEIATYILYHLERVTDDDIAEYLVNNI